MSQTIQCPHCSQSYTITAEQAPQYAGQTIQCTRCQQPFTVNLARAEPGGAPPALPRQPGFVPPSAAASIQYQSPMAAPKASGLAIASLVLACLGFVVPGLGLVAIVLGIIALLKTKDPSVGGKPLAVAGIAVGGASFIVAGCLISILLPSLNRARETANRVKCASNLRQIGQAMLLYGNDNRGQYPPTADLLLLTQGITPEVFNCPAGDETPTSSDLVQQALKAPAPLLTKGHTSYIYVGKGLTTNASAEAILVYEQMSDHSPDGGNFLWGDGHVTFELKPMAEAMIAEIDAGHNPPRYQVIRDAARANRGQK
ncbi:hypothetical protein BH09PLA1_BH09PLA1_26500 [soil metagenome]